MASCRADSFYVILIKRRTFMAGSEVIQHSERSDANH